jgi:hypothetical protein
VNNTCITKAAGGRQSRGSDKGLARQSNAHAELRHNTATVKRLTVTMMETAAGADVIQQKIARRVTEHVHKACPDAAWVALKTVPACLRKQRDKGTVDDTPLQRAPPETDPCTAACSLPVLCVR